MSPARQGDHLPRKLWWVLAALTLAWGFNWTAMKVSLSEIPPWTFRALCLAFGSGVLFAALRLGGEKLTVPKGQWGRLWLLAVLNITCWNMLVAFGLLSVPSGRAAILAYLMPAWAIPLSILVLGEKFTGRKLLGLTLGMAALFILLADGMRNLGAAPLGSLLIVGASVSWALGTVMQKRYPVSMPAAGYTAWIMLLGGVPIFAGALLFDDFSSMRGVGFWPVMGLLYNIFVAFAFAHWAWIKIATSVPVGVFSLSMLVVPVVGVMSGMLVLGERPSWAEYAALLLVLASLLTVVVPARQSR
ncbi:MAG TPA: DMT family transporter [Burkholderiales bacterium]|nr:DMT family transporter [Burkholderiales bacterium]